MAFKSIFNRGKGAGDKNPHQLSSNVRDFLNKEYLIPPAEMDNMEMVGYNETYGGFPSRSVRVFDQNAVKAKGLTINEYHELDAHPELVLFEGHIVQGKNVALTKMSYKKEVVSKA
jgi:hypothetical protein